MDVPYNSKLTGRPKTNDEKRMELTEHLAELRTRIIRAILYLVVGAIIAYQYFTPIYDFLQRPLRVEVGFQNSVSARATHVGEPTLPAHISNPPKQFEVQTLLEEIKWLREHPQPTAIQPAVFRNFHEAFLVRLRLSVICGFILVLPLVVAELAGFITPALTPEEKKPLKMLLPVSAVLLACGVTIGYLTMFYAMHWFMSYLADFPGAALYQDPNDYVIFMLKMMAAFGVAFQLPVVLMLGGFVGFITSAGLIKHWRWGVVVAVLGGVFTPSNDLPSMMLMTIPLLLLYVGSIFLVKFVERWKAAEKRKRGTS